MKEPFPFLPLWEVRRNEIVERGKGLLPGDRTRISCFKIFAGQFEIEVRPDAGTISLDGTLTMRTQSPSELIWFRRMQFQLGTRDDNHYRPDCLWYGLGLKNGTDLIGYKVFEDGRIEPGIN